MKYKLLILSLLCATQLSYAHVGPQGKDGKKETSTSNAVTNRPANYREDCVAAEAQIDMSINTATPSASQ